MIPYLKADLWDIYDLGNWIGITTNGVVDGPGRAVMGGGIALEAATRFPDLSTDLGNVLRTHGNNVWVFWNRQIITIPTKNHYKDSSKFYLIEWSLRQLIGILDLNPRIKKIYLPLLGCGLGGLKWEDVSWVIENKSLQDNRIIYVSNVETP